MKEDALVWKFDLESLAGRKSFQSLVATLSFKEGTIVKEFLARHFFSIPKH